MRVKLTKDCTTARGPKKAGSEVEHSDAWRLVQMKMAVAVDEEAIGRLKAKGMNSKGDRLPAPAILESTPEPPVTPEPKPPAPSNNSRSKRTKKADGK